MKKGKITSKKILSALAISLSLLVAATTPTQAQEANFSLIVSPAQAYLKILPGGSATHTITLENTGSDQLQVSPQVFDFATDGKTGIPVLLGKSEFAYLNLTKELSQPITLAPHGKAQLTLSFQVPPGAKNKEYPLTILFTAKKTTSSEKTPTSVTGALASNLVVLVSNQSIADKKITLTSLGATKFVDSFGKIEFSPLAKNEAYAAAIASGSAKILNWRGQRVAEFPFYPDSILGFSSRELRSFVQKNPATEKNTTIIPRLFSYDPAFLFGPYRLELYIDNSTGEQQTGETTRITIIALPFSLLGVAGLGGLTYFAYSKFLTKFTH